MASGEQAYGRTTQSMHWVGGALIIAMAVVGAVMTRIPEGALQELLYRAHVVLGLIALIVTAARLLWRFRDPWPDPPPGLSSLRAKAFKWNHILLYAVIVVMLASGVGMLLLSGLGLSPSTVSAEAIQDVPPRSAHLLASKVFVVLLFMHLGGVLQYQFTKGDTLSRIGLNVLSKPERGQ